MQQDAADTVNKDARPEDCYILFSSHTDGWRLYEVGCDGGSTASMAPTPGAAPASCGVSLLASCDDVELLERLAQEEGVPIEGVARLPRQLNARRDIFC